MAHPYNRRIEDESMAVSETPTVYTLLPKWNSILTFKTCDCISWKQMQHIYDQHKQTLQLEWSWFCSTLTHRYNIYDIPHHLCTVLLGFSRFYCQLSKDESSRRLLCGPLATSRCSLSWQSPEFTWHHGEPSQWAMGSIDYKRVRLFVSNMPTLEDWFWAGKLSIWYLCK